MGRIAYTPNDERYKALREASEKRGERNDCSVVAVAAVCDVPYEVAHETLRKLGRTRGRGTSTFQILEACKALGFTTERINRRDKIEQYPGVHGRVLKNITTHHPDRFKAVWRDGHKYLFLTSSHVAAVVNGVNVDWTRGRAKIVNFVYRVTK